MGFLLVRFKRRCAIVADGGGAQNVMLFTDEQRLAAILLPRLPWRYHVMTIYRDNLLVRSWGDVRIECRCRKPNSPARRTAGAAPLLGNRGDRARDHHIGSRQHDRQR